MAKKMLIDNTQKEEVRVVIVDGNKVEDVEFESTSRRQIKGNIYTARVIRVEPSLQAAFVDYGGNKHGFLAFSEIHPDYYNISEDVLKEVDAEVDEIIENKKKYIREREAERARYRAEKKARYEARLKEEEERLKEQNEEVLEGEEVQNSIAQENAPIENVQKEEVKEETSNQGEISNEEVIAQEEITSEETEKKPQKRKYTRRKKQPQNDENDEAPQEDFKVMSAKTDDDDEKMTDDDETTSSDLDDDDEMEIDLSSGVDSPEFEYNFEVQRKLIKVRKLYHRSAIQDVIKEGQILLVQVVKEERGNKGASLTTYLSLAGRYGVLMPNRIKSGGVSRKITDAADRKRLKDMIKKLPLSMDMSLIIRTAGEGKTDEEIVKDYNYLIRTWNIIRHSALQNKVPSLIYEEGDLIKRALRDMCSKDIAEIIIDGDEAYKAARDFVKILSPQSLRKLKNRKPYETPVFQRYQVEAQLDKLHDPVVQLESGGYLVINPTEALVAIDVNSGRATKEMDIEETALKTNLEAADEIARQLKMRDLAGLIVVDFIDMDDPKNNIAVEKRMKEVLKNDRARVQVARMSCFGLLEISRQRMHSSFMESNYETCPYCKGHGVIRTSLSSATLILRAIEEEAMKNRSSSVSVSVPTDVAVYLLNKKRKNLTELEERYGISVVILADPALKNVSDYTIERQKIVKPVENTSESAPTKAYDEEMMADDEPQNQYEEYDEENENTSNRRYNRRFNRRRGRYDRKNGLKPENKKESPMILYSSDNLSIDSQPDKKKTTWWRRLIG